MKPITNINQLDESHANAVQVILNGTCTLGVCVLCGSISNVKCSDYGYERESLGKECTHLKEYDMSKHCPEGQNFYQKPSNGQRPIPGDLCTNKKDFITYTNESCKGHDAKLRPPSNPTEEEVSHSLVSWCVSCTLLTAGNT